PRFTLFPYTTLFRSRLYRGGWACTTPTCRHKMTDAVQKSRCYCATLDPRFPDSRVIESKMTSLPPDDPVSEALLGKSLVGDATLDRKSTRLNSSHLG